MKNFVQQGVNVRLTAPAEVKSGDGVLVGSLFGVAATDAAAGNGVECTTEGVFTLPKVTGTGLTQGAVVYWNDTAKNVTTASSGNHLIGHALADAASAATQATVRLAP